MNPSSSMCRLALAAMMLGLPALLPRAEAQVQPTVPSSSVPSTRLFHIAAERFSREPSGQGRLERGWLDASGGFTVHSIHPTVLAPTMPENALGKRLIFTEAWHALGELGPTARANFRLKPPETAIVIAGLLYFEVEPHPEARPDAGLLVNVSNRGYVEPGRPLTAGFVVTEQSRRVLIRGIGPALAPFQVTQPLPDPVLTLFRGTDPLGENDTWGSTPDPTALAARFAQVGAFALPADSLDAALVVVLPPGAYTAQVRSADTRGGEALVEVYVIP